MTIKEPIQILSEKDFFILSIEGFIVNRLNNHITKPDANGKAAR
jgi:hypothetical protein